MAGLFHWAVAQSADLISAGRMRLLAFFTLSFALTAPAFAGPLFDALDRGRYQDALGIAQGSGDTLIRAYARWAALKEPGGHVYVSFADAIDFYEQHPGWPLDGRVRVSIEAAMLRDGANGGQARNYCEKTKPISGRGMIACAEMLAPGDSRRAEMIRQAWVQGDYEADEEDRILVRYHSLLRAIDHTRRIERLLFDERVGAARRILFKIGGTSRKIAEARIALITKARNADGAVAAVPASARNAPGLLFDRIRYRHAKGMQDGARELMTTAPNNPPYPDHWWKLREYYAREAMKRGQYANALQIVSRGGALGAINKAEQLWLMGWIKYTYLGNPRGAYEDFYALFHHAETPVTKARAAYWATRAAERNQNPGIAKDWLTRGARYTTVFYGQLAFAKLNPGKPLALPDPVITNRSGMASFSNKELARVIRLLASQDQRQTVRLFVEHWASILDRDNVARLAEFALSIGHPELAVRTAKTALRRNIVLLHQGWPRIPVPPHAALPKPMVLAIVRQESEFDPKARSPANAQGLMQLLPPTAAQTARRSGIPFAPAHLYDPNKNMVLGSIYLSRLENAYGSLPAAIAAYNAGPGNVSRWVREYGGPGGSLDATLKFMETIPFMETRNYVQRVLENRQMYQALENPRAPMQVVY
jgi:soluble lytic murein transglycosylase